MFAAAAAANSALAQNTTDGTNTAVSAGPEYISSPDWAKTPRDSESYKYQPEVAVSQGVPGKVVVDCAARADGRLVDCKTVRAEPMGYYYEFAGPLVVSRLFQLKPTLPDGRSVSGMRVVVTVSWKRADVP
jgi:hypothetical protein